MKKRIVLICVLLVAALTIYHSIAVNFIQADSGAENKNSMMT